MYLILGALHLTDRPIAKYFYVLMMAIQRKKERKKEVELPSKYVYYPLKLYFSGLSLRKTS
jgi:hypothetical protein